MLSIENIKKGFVAPDGERIEILDVPGFRLEAARHVALEGGSGSGKTTFLNLIAGILQPDSGRITIAETDVTALGEAARDRYRAEHIGYVFQTFNLLHGYTALENVELAMSFGRGVRGDYARHLLERVGLADRMNYQPRQLSVGQQQRVAVARALANKPELVLADEPTGNLDHKHAGEALELIREICREGGAALLLVSHDREILGRFEDVRSLSDINRVLQAEKAGSAS